MPMSMAMGIKHGMVPMGTATGQQGSDGGGSIGTGGHPLIPPNPNAAIVQNCQKIPPHAVGMLPPNLKVALVGGPKSGSAALTRPPPLPDSAIAKRLADKLKRQEAKRIKKEAEKKALEEAKAERARQKEAQRKVAAEKKAALKLERQRKQELKQKSKTGTRGIEDEEQSDAATTVATIVSTSKAESNNDSSTGILAPQPQLPPPSSSSIESSSTKKTTEKLRTSADVIYQNHTATGDTVSSTATVPGGRDENPYKRKASVHLDESDMGEAQKVAKTQEEKKLIEELMALKD